MPQDDCSRLEALRLLSVSHVVLVGQIDGTTEQIGGGHRRPLMVRQARRDDECKGTRDGTIASWCDSQVCRHSIGGGCTVT